MSCLVLGPHTKSFGTPVISLILSNCRHERIIHLPIHILYTRLLTDFLLFLLLDDIFITRDTIGGLHVRLVVEVTFNIKAHVGIGAEAGTQAGQCYSGNM